MGAIIEAYCPKCNNRNSWSGSTVSDGGVRVRDVYLDDAYLTCGNCRNGFYLSEASIGFVKYT